LVCNNKLSQDIRNVKNCGIYGAGIFNKISVVNHQVGFSYPILDHPGDFLLEITTSNFCFNDSLGIDYPLQHSKNLPNLFWGSQAGPYHPGYNPTGIDNQVSYMVNPIPFLTEPADLAPLIPIQICDNVEENNDSYTIYWHPSPNLCFSHYKINYSDNSGYPYEESIDNITDTSYTFSRILSQKKKFVSIVFVDSSGNESWYSKEIILTGTLTDIKEKHIIAKEYGLLHNFPNPFNANTTIVYSIPKESIITIKIYNMLGEEISTLVNKYINVGRHTVEFIASNQPSGIYFYRFISKDYTETKKMILIQ